jgi:hypothetical protein
MRFLFVLGLALVACGGGGGGGGAVGASVGDYKTLEDILDDPLVQDMLARTGVEVHLGSEPPLLEGVYDLELTVESSDFGDDDIGLVTTGVICLFDQSPTRLSIRDPAEYRDVFVTGSGDDFTIWFVVETPSFLSLCFSVDVLVLTGRRSATGELDAKLASAMVGWYGTSCSEYFDPATDLGKAVVAGATATPTGPPCD